MGSAAAERLAALLGDGAQRASFSAARTAPTRDLSLEVRGVGPITLPVPQAQAKQLCLLARPARYGQGTRTILDRGVRDTWEIPKSRVKLDRRRFNTTLAPMLQRLGRDLGIASGRALRAQLHSLLVYSRGQFFLPHQDSEKDDEMVGTLFVGLPSTFRGGALEVRHGSRSATYRGSKQALSFVAFYSDCRHQVKPVTSGYRTVLTFNLLLGGGRRGPAEEPDAELLEAIAGCVEEHFSPGQERERLVYLLDHEYTRSGLGLSRLKGDDARRVALLQAAAQRAGCELVLALADVHETWSAYEEDDYYYGSRRRRWERYEDEDELDGTGAGDSYELQELIESEVKLDSWLERAGGRAERVDLPVDDQEVCASTPSGELEPYSSDYEGYMGNWGNTLDRWYHRGAVVLWPVSRGFAVRARVAPARALDALAGQARRGDLAGAREAAATLSGFWGQVAGRAETRGFAAKALRAARAVDEPALAGMLMAPLRVRMLNASHAEALSALAAQYGEEWTADLVAGWSAELDRRHRVGAAHRAADGEGPTPEQWLLALPGLCEALARTPAGGVVAVALVKGCWAWAQEAIEEALARSAPSQREAALSALGPPIAAILTSAGLLGAELPGARRPGAGSRERDRRDDRAQSGVRDGASKSAQNGVHEGASKSAQNGAAEVTERALAVLCGDPDLVGCALCILRAAPKARWGAASLDRLAAHCAVSLRAALDRPERAPGDWSLQLPRGCECERCQRLGAFLRDSEQIRLEWPLAESGRTHVQSRINAAELPVSHQTRRSGRPYTLILTKTEALFERERQRRRQDRKDLAWLEARLAPRGR